MDGAEFNVSKQSRKSLGQPYLFSKTQVLIYLRSLNTQVHIRSLLHRFYRYESLDRLVLFSGNLNAFANTYKMVFVPASEKGDESDYTTLISMLLQMSTMFTNVLEQEEPIMVQPLHQL